MANENRPGGVSDERRQQRHDSHVGSTWAAFLDDLCSIGHMDRPLAECAAVSVLCGLEQRVMGEEARDLEAQLPFRLRELLQRCPIHAGKPARKFGREEYFQMVAEDLRKDPGEVESIIRSVLATVRGRITEGEADQFGAMLPSDLRALWARPI